MRTGPTTTVSGLQTGNEQRARKSTPMSTLFHLLTLRVTEYDQCWRRVTVAAHLH